MRLQADIIQHCSKSVPLSSCFPNIDSDVTRCKQHWLTACDTNSSDYSLPPTLITSRRTGNIAQKREKSNHEKKVCFDQTCAPGDYVLLSRQSLITFIAKRLVAECCSNLMPKRHGAYRVLSVRFLYLEILLAGVERFVNINRATFVRQGRGTGTTPVRNCHTRGNKSPTCDQTKREEQDIIRNWMNRPSCY